VTRTRRLVLAAALVLLAPATTAGAQDEPRVFLGALGGFSALSADAQANTSPPQARVGLYAPDTGPAINVFAGLHLARYFSVQANYVWNRNHLTLTSSRAAPTEGSFYEQERHSSQHAFVIDGLIYFRALDSRVRPYLGTGLAVVHFASAVIAQQDGGLDPPDGDFSRTALGLRSHVGIDFAITPRLGFRYSFSETIGPNPVSPHLSPPGKRGLENFQNLFGLVAQF
jgi:opacity protein-like surface antigen